VISDEIIGILSLIVPAGVGYLVGFFRGKKTKK